LWYFVFLFPPFPPSLKLISQGKAISHYTRCKFEGMILERLLYKNFRILLLEAAHAYFPDGCFLDILETVIMPALFAS